MKSEAQPRTSDSTAAFDGGKARITEILERELQRLKSNAEREAAKIIAEARQEAQEIVSQAEAKAKQEAKDRLKRETQSLLADAEEDSKRSVADAEQRARQQCDQILAEARQEAETFTKKATEDAARAADELSRSAAELKQKAQQEAAETEKKAIDEAERIVKDARDSAEAKGAEEANRILAEARQKGKACVDEAWDRAKASLEEAAVVINEAMQRLGHGVKTLSEEGQGQAESGCEIGAGPSLILDAPPSTEPGPTSEIPVAPGEQDELFMGSVELEVVGGVEHAELSRWTEALRHVPHLRVLSAKNPTPERGERFLILTEMPTPLVRILHNMPSVKHVNKENGRIVVTLLERHVTSG